jgi:hypothetical protein
MGYATGVAAVAGDVPAATLVVAGATGTTGVPGVEAGGVGAVTVGFSTVGAVTSGVVSGWAGAHLPVVPSPDRVTVVVRAGLAAGSRAAPLYPS